MRLKHMELYFVGNRVQKFDLLKADMVCTHEGRPPEFATYDNFGNFILINTDDAINAINNATFIAYPN